VSSLPPPPFPTPPPDSDPAARLQHFEKSVAGLRAGLVDLEATPSFLMLTSDSLTGKTQVHLGQAASDAEALWPLLLVVGQRLDRARSVEAGSAGNKSSRNRDLATLLATPLENVAAPDFDGRSLTLGEAVAIIRDRYSAVRNGASEIETLWLNVLPRIDAASATLASLNRDADKLGVVEPLIGRAQSLADDLGARLVNDPLSVHAADGSNLDSKVADAVRQISTLQTGRVELSGDLLEAKQLLAALRILKSRAAASFAESQQKVLDPTALVHTPSNAIFDNESRGLGPQLNRVIANEDNWNAQRTLLDSWLGSARKLERQLDAAEVANSKPLAEREALRGRLRAYQAKMAAIGQAEDMVLTGVVDEARDELFTVPTDLLRAAQIIGDLAERLRQAN
jgi:hypothetical protein